MTYFIFETDNTLLWPLGAAITDVRVASPLSGYSNDSLVISGKENPVSLQLNYRIGQVQHYLNPSLFFSFLRLFFKLEIREMFHLESAY